MFRKSLYFGLNILSYPSQPGSSQEQGSQGHQGSPSPRHWAPPWAQAKARLGCGTAGRPSLMGPMAGKGRDVGSWTPALPWHHWGSEGGWNGVLGCGKGEEALEELGRDSWCWWSPLELWHRAQPLCHVLCSRPRSLLGISLFISQETYLPSWRSVEGAVG